jgi:hypothetical protein
MNILEVTDAPAIPIPRVLGSQSPSLSLHQVFLRCSGDLRDLQLDWRLYSLQHGFYSA